MVYQKTRILCEILSRAIKSAAICHEAKTSFQMNACFQMEIASVIIVDLVKPNLMGKLSRDAQFTVQYTLQS